MDFLKNFKGYKLYGLQEIGGKKGAIELTEKDLKRYNNKENKYGIYFTPNGGFGEGDKKRKKVNAKYITCSMVDIDHLDKTREGLLEPTYIVKTGKGHHLYFMYEEPILYKDYGKEWTKHLTQLLGLLDGDPQVKDIARIMRVPEHKYWKDGKGETTIELIKSDGPKYNYFDFKRKVDLIAKPKEVNFNLKKEWLKRSKPISQLMNDIDLLNIGDVLERVSGGQYIIDGTDIEDGGRKTKGYKVNIRENYVYTFSDHSERPIGGCYAIVKNYTGYDTREVLEWFKDEFYLDIGDSIKSYETVMKEIKPDVTTIIEKNKDTLFIGSGNKKIRINYKERSMDFIDESGKSLQVHNLVEGLIEPLGYLTASEGEMDTEKKLIVKLITKQSDKFVIILKPFGGGAELKKQLMKYGIVLNPLLLAMPMLVSYLYNCDTKYNYTDKLGLQEINGSRYLIRKGGTYIQGDLFVDISFTNSELISAPEQTKMSWKEIVNNIGKGYDLKVSYPLLLLSIIHIYIYYWRDKKIQVPGLFLEGLKESGKSLTKEKILGDLLGYNTSMAASSKTFVYEVTIGNYMPIGLNEWRNAGIPDIEGKTDIIRNTFDGIDMSKGTKDLDVRRFPLKGQFLFDGQTKMGDGATLSRLISIMTTPKYKGDLGAYDVFQEKNILGNVLEIFKDKKEIEKFLALKKSIAKEIKRNMKELTELDSDRLLENYIWIFALGRHLGLKEYESYIYDVFVEQVERSDSDDILDIYTKTINIFLSNKKGGVMDVIDGGIVLDINLEETRLSDRHKEDLLSFWSTINTHFGKSAVEVQQGLYLDFDYIFQKKVLYNRFLQLINGLYIPANHYEIPKHTTKTREALKIWLETNFKNSSKAEDIYMAFMGKEEDQEEDWSSL